MVLCKIKFSFRAAAICVFLCCYCYRPLFAAFVCPSFVNETSPACIDQGRQDLWTRSDCLSANCCWIQQEHGVNCYQKECAVGFFGTSCQFQCRCAGNVACDPLTGDCPAGCDADRWGTGCLLDNDCTYNDASGVYYMGKKNRTISNRLCVQWSTQQRAYPASQFPDGDFAGAANFCRNPKPSEGRAWCYWRPGFRPKWDFCLLNASCSCPVGRYDVNCRSECHCYSPSESCEPLTGHCRSGCHERWSGPGCSECADGYFGAACQYACHCSDVTESCDKSTGDCVSGCSAGWTGVGCQAVCPAGYFGSHCESTCNCALSSEVCNPITGDCQSGCKAGYAGSGCQILLPVMTRVPWLVSRNASAISVRWREWRQTQDRGSGPVIAYVIFYRRTGDTEWKASNQITGSARVATIDGLVQDQVYQLRVAAIHQSGIVGVPSPHVTVSTCGKPLSGPISLKLRPKSSAGGSDDGDDENTEDEQASAAGSKISLAVEWKFPPRDKFNCISIRTSKVYIRRPGVDTTTDRPSPTLWTLVQTVYIHNSQINNVDPYDNLTVGVSIVNSAELESPIEEIIYVGKSGPVRSLTVIARSSTELTVRWSPPMDSNGVVLYYLMSYRELRVGACPPGPVQTGATGTPWSPMIDVDADRTELEIPDLVPYSRYQVKVWPKTAAGRGQLAVAVGNTESAVPGNITGLHVVSLRSTYISLQWTAIDCRNQHGAHVGYTYDVTTSATDGSSDELPGIAVVTMGIVNSTAVELRSLVPFTNYEFRVAFTNERFPGPRSRVQFMTLEDVPPPPRDVVIQSRLSESLTVGWKAPEPAHGIITGYTVGYRRRHQPDDGLSIVSLPAVNFTHEITGLEPHSIYRIQVRAQTKVGDGNWTIIEASTDESIPSEPLNFVNVSRSSSAIEFRWLPPLQPNGVILSYQMTCSLATSSGRRLDRGNVAINKLINVTLPREFHVTDLLPGMCYVCILKASTSQGFGPSATRLVWTEPDVAQISTAPKLELSKVMETSVAVLLRSTAPADSMEYADNLYRIVVEKRVSNTRQQRSPPAAATDNAPCGLSYAKLLDYRSAMRDGAPCYIAAELPPDDREQMFIVGDGRTYGGYYNAPLEREAAGYRIWFGVVITVDGASASLYEFVDTTPVFVKSNIGNASPTAAAAVADSTSMVVGIVVGMLLVVIIIGIVMAIVFYRRRRQQPGTDEMKQIPIGVGLKSGATLTPGVNDGIDGDDVSDYQAEATPLFNDRYVTMGTGSVATMGNRKPLRVDELGNYVAAKKLATENNLIHEYNSLPHGLLFPYDVARRPENKMCNRYGNIVAYDHSRVVLDGVDDHSTDYINANYIDGYKRPGAFVATQGPSKHTLGDLWRMAWQLRSSRIVMLANLIEDGRRKCEQYWPDPGSAKTFSGITVKLLDTEHFADFKIRTFDLSKDGSSMTVRQFHFTAWPDHGVPQRPTSLLAFRRKFRNFDNGPTEGPAIAHCSAGVGRTGTFIALDFLLDQAKSEGVVDVLGCVRAMRQSRVLMVQTQEQYIFVYDALLEALATGETSIPSAEFRQRYAELKTVNLNTGKSKCHEEFEMLTHMSMRASEGEQVKLDALKPENVSKNRNVDIIPRGKFARPYLLTCSDGSTDYINAVFIDGYKQRDAFIVTQMPLPNTVTDFWTMIHDHSCRTIVMLNELDTYDPSVGGYFPLNPGRQQHGPFTIELVAVDNRTNPDIVVRDLKLTYKQRMSVEPVTVRHYQFLAWPPRSTLPNGRTAMLSLLGLLEMWQQRSGNGAIVVHCMDGASRSGLVCALSYMVERLKVEQDIDVFQSVQHVRINRPQLVPTFEQYEYLYDMAVEYLDCFETYANFK